MSISLRSTLVFLFFTITSLTHAQYECLNLGYSHEYGNIMPHTNIIHSLIKGHFSTHKLYSEFKTDQGKQQVIPGMKYGLQVQYSNWANPEDFGWTAGTNAYLNFPLISQNKLIWDFKVGLGIGYIDQPFDYQTNYKNGAIGSKINALVEFGSRVRVPVHPHIQLTGGLNFYHMSNGSYQMPNLGINVASFTLGVNYQIKQQEIIETDHSFEKKWRYNVSNTITAKEVYPVLGKKYFADITSFSIIRHTHQKSAFGLGMDYFYDPSKVTVFTSKNDFTDQSAKHQLGIIGQYYFTISDVYLGVQMGYYLMNKVSLPVYHKLLFQKYFKNNYFFQFELKSHWANADHFGIGVGRSW